MRAIRGAGAALALLTMVLVRPAAAIGSTSFGDGANNGVGVDFDAACVRSTAITPPTPNSITTAGCPGVTTYDGSTTSTDLTGGSLGSTASNGLHATWSIVGSVPPPGSTDFAALDTPGSSAGGALDTGVAGGVSRSGGVSYVLMFQNKTLETGVRQQGSGCFTTAGSLNLATYGAWQDGYHFFLMYEVLWDGRKWVHTVAVGEYDPLPTGGFAVRPLGVNDGTGWFALTQSAFTATATSGSGATLSLDVPGSIDTYDPKCVNDTYRTALSRPGDTIGNVKAVTLVGDTLTSNLYAAAGYGTSVDLPSAVPHVQTPVASCATWNGATRCGVGVWVGVPVAHTVTTYAISDVTDGNSTAGLFNTNISGIAYSPGLVPNVDDLAPGETCVPPGWPYEPKDWPFFTPATACDVDDDSVAHGSVSGEFWDTTHGFTA